MADNPRRYFTGAGNITPTTIDDKLALNKYDTDSESHIKLNEEICRKCQQQVCLYICPASCYKLRDGKLSYDHRGCLECGGCHISCKEEAIEWSYPRGGLGISFQYG